eukprot:3809836-Prorocentrum_lima.AAC.1
MKKGKAVLSAMRSCCDSFLLAGRQCVSISPHTNKARQSMTCNAGFCFLNSVLLQLSVRRPVDFS